MRTTDVPTTFRDMWQTRPARPRDDRIVAGVASGIARRYDIDPVLVRVGFVVATISGIGILLYVLGWIVLPDTPADADAPRRRPRVLLLAAIVVAVGIGLGGVLGGESDMLLPLLAVAGLLFLLHTSRGERGPVAPPPPVAPENVTLMVKDPSDTRVPPSWDPLGAAPFAWDLPEPSEVAEPQPRRLPVTAVTLGTTLVATAVVAAIMLLTGALTFATVLGVALAVLGCGLVVGSFLHAGRGLVPFAVIGMFLTWGALAPPFDVVDDLTIVPAAANQIAPSYTSGAGDIDLDLRLVDLSVSPGAPALPIRTQITAGAGDITIVVPANADVTFTGASGLGDVEYVGREDQDGPGARVSVTDLGADGIASGRPLIIDAQAGAGNVEVQRD